MEKCKVSVKKQKIQKEPNGNFRTKKYNHQNLRGSLEKRNKRMDATEEITSHQEHRTTELPNLNIRKKRLKRQ